MRRREIDWIRNICILMLFIYHTAALFTEYGDFYVKSQKTNMFSNIFILLTFSWYMPLLFFLAGASTYFALQKRTTIQYIKERFIKLFIPFLFGIIVLVPPQTYLARLWRGETALNYFSHLVNFFTNVTDFKGFDGTFTPAHLWFIIFLFIISILGVILIKLFKTNFFIKFTKPIKKHFFKKYGPIYITILLIFLESLPNLGGKGLLTNLLVFSLGYITYSDSDNIMKLSNSRKKFLISNIVVILIGTLYVFTLKNTMIPLVTKYIDIILKCSLILTSCGTIVGYGIVYLNKEHFILRYLNTASFPVYIIHQTILLILAFYIIPLTLPTWISILAIVSSSFILTFIAYEIIRRIKPIRILIGLK